MLQKAFNHLSIPKLEPLIVPWPSNIVSIESEEQFNTSLRKVQDESLPAIFYFTAVWCGPCRLLSPVIGQLSEKYPHVTTYKIDIDKLFHGFESSGESSIISYIRLG
ncbi:Thioredoxin O1, mitochondrial [Capsicum baccatum]|uniref:Thioredoxin O1, mitochondrial n=1 Tax=Capsicum baccatum TaxID=33114 RepID=A0A2G2XDL7_CAPBA|nr:Thioredoxin O1, mitochondrial [Capsicum baccatum]